MQRYEYRDMNIVRNNLRNLVMALIMPAMILSCGRKEEFKLITAKVETGELSETVTATGTLESVTQVDVGTQVTGIIDKLYADFNTVVKKGQLIAEIEKTLLQSDLQSAQANVESARASYEYNLSNFKRNKALHDKQLLSDYEFQTSKRDLDMSRSAYEKAKADKVRAAKNLNYAEIYSPIDGIVISRDVEVGQTVVSSMNVANLYTIADLDNMQVVGTVDEADIGRVKVGQSVMFTVDAYPESKFYGSVTQVRLKPTTESNVVTYEVIVSASNQDHKLIPGLTANLTIYTLQEKNVTLVPNRAFSFDAKDYPEAPNLPKLKGGATGKDVVWVLNHGVLEARNVVKGASNGINTVVLSGLHAGDIVALEVSRTQPGPTPNGNTDAQSPFAPKPPKGGK